MEKILYHGTDAWFDKFSDEFLSSSDSIDQYGSGFYFYGNKSKTTLHGNHCIKCKVKINKSIEHNTMRKISKSIIERLIIVSPTLDSTLDNFGDIENDGFEKVLRIAVESYKHLDMLSCLNSIGNDFFPGKSVASLLRKFALITGIDCITDKERDIYVILTASQIRILEHFNLQEDE